MTSIRHFRHRRARTRVAGFLGVLAMATAAIPISAASTPLTVGVQYVIPEFVPGAKPRTPETPDVALAEYLAQSLSRELLTQAIPAGDIADDAADLTVTTVHDLDAVPQGMVAHDTGYVARPMAILRSDTDIKTWEQLKGRTLCVAEGGRYLGELAERYGAVERRYPAPADALLALRIGQCDATVQDEPLLKALLKLPEWKKFSATLPRQPATPLVVLARADAEALNKDIKQALREWQRGSEWATLIEQRAHDIAFEVYLDQEVADCH